MLKQKLTLSMILLTFFTASNFGMMTQFHQFKENHPYITNPLAAANIATAAGFATLTVVGLTGSRSPLTLVVAAFACNHAKTAEIIGKKNPSSQEALMSFACNLLGGACSVKAAFKYGKQNPALYSIPPLLYAANLYKLGNIANQPKVLTYYELHDID
jgi:hypothetical protein